MKSISRMSSQSDFSDKLGLKTNCWYSIQCLINKNIGSFKSKITVQPEVESETKNFKYYVRQHSFGKNVRMQRSEFVVKLYYYSNFEST